MLTRMKAAYGPILCRSLYINSGEPADSTAKTWYPYLSLLRRTRVSYDIYVQGTTAEAMYVLCNVTFIVSGCNMTEADNTAARALMEDLVRTVIIPSMERRLRDLLTTVAERKKGLKKWKHLLMRSSAIEAEPLPSPESGRSSVDSTWSSTYTSRFRYNTPEAQLRLTGDIAFYLQDFEVCFHILLFL